MHVIKYGSNGRVKVSSSFLLGSYAARRLPEQEGLRMVLNLTVFSGGGNAVKRPSIQRDCGQCCLSGHINQSIMRSYRSKKCKHFLIDKLIAII